jgi:signal transduction histidine kinase
MNLLNNIDLISVGVAISANIILGTIVFFSDRRNATSILFLLESIVISIWSLLNYFTYQITSLFQALWVERLVLFFAVPMSIVFVLLMYTFPEKKWIASKKTTYFLVIISLLTMFWTLTPYVFNGVEVISDVPTPQPVVMPGIVLFGLVAVGSIPIGIYFLVRKFILSRDIQRTQFKFLLWGVVIMFSLIILFNFIFPAFLQNSRFIPLSAVFTFPFVSLTFYAVYKHRLFNVRTATVAVLTLVLSISALVEVIFSNNFIQLLLRFAIFLIVLAVSVLMNRFVETIARQSEELQKANEGQANLMHIMNHQIKGRLGIGRNIFAELLTDDYGKIPEEAKAIVKTGLDEMGIGVNYVQGILKGISAETGTLPYDMQVFDFKKLVEDIVFKEKELAEKKGLEYEINIANGNYSLKGDSIQLSEAIKNLIDNSIHYTLNGKITINLEKASNKVLFNVKDTGVGLSNDDKANLFKAGGRGKDSIKVNTDSTGYGLVFVKGVMEAHHGKVWAESEGKDKGSQFYIEIPVLV